MIKLLRNLLNGQNSKNAAKSRLQFVLVQDRSGLPSEELAAFKKELVEVIEKYFVIDEQGFDINYKRDTDMTTLLINSPIVVRRQTPKVAAEKKAAAETAVKGKEKDKSIVEPAKSAGAAANI